MVLESKTTSCLKALLLRAWRERWTDLQWGINIKTVLPRGVSGDVYDLADCILQQAVVGSGANLLILSYLQHSLSAQLVSYAAVLQGLARFNEFTKVYCLNTLLEFLEGMLPGITCTGQPEETVLAKSILSIVNWLVLVITKNKDHVENMSKAVAMLETISKEEFYISMIWAAKFVEPQLQEEFSRNCLEAVSTVGDNANVCTKILNAPQDAVNTFKRSGKGEIYPISALIQCWLEIKLVKDPATSSRNLCRQLCLFKKLKKFSWSRLLSEFIRASLLSLHDVHQTSHECQWGAFTFLKVPHVLAELIATIGESPNVIVEAVELLLRHQSLLDMMDVKSSCSTLEYLLGEFVEVKLLTDNQMKTLMEKRVAPSNSLKTDNTTTTAGIPEVIICIKPTLDRILRTLSTDDDKIQDPLCGMLHRVLTCNSFELILAVATVQGQLQTLVSRLIAFNECSKSGSDKARAQSFDISFLMLVAIVQNHGLEAVLEVEGDSIFEQWIKCCMVERHKPKPPEQLLRLGDSAIVDQLLTQFNAGESDINISSTLRWQDALFNMSGVMHEVLVAWEEGTLAASDVKRILDAVRGQMCCLPVAAATWLCSYMRTAPQESLLKPANMVQQLLSPLTSEDDNLTCRWQLAGELIRRMQRDIQLQGSSSSGNQQQQQQQLASRQQPAMEQFETAWGVAMSRGWLDHASAQTFHALHESPGAKWIVNATLRQMRKITYSRELQRATDVALALFHVDVIECTEALLSDVLPQLLFNEITGSGLMDPHLSAFATLTCNTIYTALEYLELDGGSSSIATTSTAIPTASTTTNPDNAAPPPPKMACRSNSALALLNSVRQLFILFKAGLAEGLVTQQTFFLLRLLECLVRIEDVNNVTAVILNTIPPRLITDLITTLPNFFSYTLISQLHDVNSSVGRTNMAKDLCVLRNYKLRTGVSLYANS